MRQSQLFTKINREVPKEEVSVNAKLLIQAGFIDKLTAGIYSFLPLGFLVLKNIERIIREEMNKISAQEVLLPALHPKANWEETGRWDYPEMFKLKNRNNKDFSLGWTHEEIVTPLLKKFITSYKDLPVYVYQIQDKFRDELRAKSGLLRGREFIMKDLYSFHVNEQDLDKYYEVVKKAYFNVFNRCGLKKITYLTLASGGNFSKYSDEFQMLTEAGEDEIYVCDKCKIAVNKEVIKEVNYQCPNCKSKKLEVKKAIEVGNIFKLNKKYSEPFDLKYKTKDGVEEFVLMGCYGIGLGRLLGSVVEAYHDENGIIWPLEVAPFQVHLISLKNTKKEADKLYKYLQEKNIKVLYDDRDNKSAGEKFIEADLIGIPFRIVLSERTLKDNSLEVKKRNKAKVELIKIKEIEKWLSLNI